MDSGEPDISFDAQGYCNYCTEYFDREPGIIFKGKSGRDKLQEIVDRIKVEGKNKEYDSILGISGGVDSTYVAYWAKKLGLRPLAVHFDNGWNSELAVKNIENILNVLDIDLYTYVVDWEEFKDLQLSFLKASVANSEIPTDHGFLALLYKIAAEKNIPYFLTGTNFATEGILPAAYGYLSVDLKHILAIQKQFGSKKLRTYPKLSLTKYLYYRFSHGVTKVPILNYIDYDVEDAMRTIEDKLGWQYYGGKHYESIYTRFFQSYILPRKFGIDKRKAHFASLICSGQMNRGEALDKLSEDPYPEQLMIQDKEYVTKKLGLTEEGFERIMNQSVKSFNDYPNNSKIFSFLSSLNEWRNKRSAPKSSVVVNTQSGDQESISKAA